VTSRNRTVESAGLSLELDRKGLHAHLRTLDGGHLLTLPLFAAVDRVDAVDETLAVDVRVEDGAIHAERRSTIWERAATTIRAVVEGFEVESWVEGEGALGDVRLLGGRSLVAPATGTFPVGSSFRTLFSPNPGDPARLVRGAAEAAVIGVSGDGSLGRGHWFFTPAPLYLALHRDELAGPEEEGSEPWLTLSVSAPVDELDVLQLSYRPGDRSFELVLEHEGHRRAAGRHALPTVILAPAPVPYAGLRAHRAALAARGAAPPVVARETPAWWREPIFCGWGAQCHLAAVDAGHAADYATQERYDAFLARLAEHGVVPPTIVLDDKWQLTYGANEPDPAKWPDLRGWIDARHAEGRHVLLWWKAWDWEGLPDELCIRTPDGAPVALDPSNPRAVEALRRSVGTLLSPGGLDADGLKIDFTARTPSGRALAAAGAGWGISLLHRLLAVVYAEAKRAKQDALVITHTPHPAFVDVTDMVRLNDMLRLDDPGPLPPVVPQMRYRAAVASAACPDVLVDTDDWCVRDRAQWRAYLETKGELGVQSLYYATHIDLTGEPLEAEDYAAIRRVWGTA
jgi:hypothetical protein